MSSLEEFSNELGLAQLSYLTAQLRSDSSLMPQRPNRQRNIYGSIGEKPDAVMSPLSLDGAHQASLLLHPSMRKPKHELDLRQPLIYIASPSTASCGTSNTQFRGVPVRDIFPKEEFAFPGGISVPSSDPPISERRLPIPQQQTRDNHILSPVPVRLGIHRAAVQAWESRLLSESCNQIPNQHSEPPNQRALGMRITVMALPDLPSIRHALSDMGYHYQIPTCYDGKQGSSIFIHPYLPPDILGSRT